MNWLRKIFGLHKKYPDIKIDPSRPCWRCLQVFEKGPRVSHQCQHGYNCVMLGWRCITCRRETAMRWGHCGGSRCTMKECKCNG